MIVIWISTILCIIIPLFMMIIGGGWWYFFSYSSSSSSTKNKKTKDPKVFAFFHPYCSGGGGGERVLWKMIQVLQQQNKQKKNQQQSNNNSQSSSSSSPNNITTTTIIIYTIDPPDTDEAQLRKDAERRFDVLLTEPIQLISLYEYKDYLLPQPFLSMVMESIGTMKLAYQALKKQNEQSKTITSSESSSSSSLSSPSPLYSNYPPTPDVYIDTTGCAFTFAIVKWMIPHAWIVAYVHYPTISTDMMEWEWKQSSHDNNDSDHRRRPKWKTIIKLIYYWIFAIAYGMVGSLADLVMVNSTWTYNHIASLWGGKEGGVGGIIMSKLFGNNNNNNKKKNNIHIVYPPCRVPSETTDTTTNTTNTQKQRQQRRRQNTIVSIGQFRPEKNHLLQIEALETFFQMYPQYNTSKQRQEQNNHDDDDNDDDNDDKNDDKNSLVKLLLIGSCRGGNDTNNNNNNDDNINNNNDTDYGRVQQLQQLVKNKENHHQSFSFSHHVEFCINPPYSILQQAMEHASIGIHTMRQEHFGIGIVEMMASGLITIAHDSGGPKTDIIVQPGITGFLATTKEEYATAIYKALSMSNVEMETMRQKARESATRFSDEVFDDSFRKVLTLLSTS